VLLLVVRRAVRRYHRRFEKASGASFARIPFQGLSRTTVPFFLVHALFLGAQTLILGSSTARVLASATTIALFWQAGTWAVVTASAWLEHMRRRSLAADRAGLGSISIIGVILNAVIWALVVLLTLDNLGIDILDRSFGAHPAADSRNR
jgi:hypothetical protein